MILEVNGESLRDIAAAVAAALKRPGAPDLLETVEHKVLKAIRSREDALELEAEEARALHEALIKRAWDQRRNTEGEDYADLAERIARALNDPVPPLEVIDET